MFNIFKRKEEYLSTPGSGEIISLKEVPDKAFSKKMLGDGFAVDINDKIIKSPCNGEVVQVFNTGHAVGIETESGLEVLVHIGIDTVKLDGEGFKKLVKNGDLVKKGTPLVEIDLDYIRENAPSLITPVVITNMEKVKKMEIVKEGVADMQEDVLKIELA